MSEKLFTFEGEVIHERYYNYESTYGVYEIHTRDKSIIMEFGSDCVILAGNMQKLALTSYKFHHMKITYNKKYASKQLNCGFITAIKPSTIVQQLEFLRLVTSERRAKALIDVYPNIVNDVMENSDDPNFKVDLDKVYGVGDKTWGKIKDAIVEHYVLSDIMITLMPLGVTFNAIKKLLDAYSTPDALKKDLSENPYILTRIKGFGFKRVDAIALKMNPKLIDSKYRMDCFIIDFLSQMGNNEGHTYLKEEDLRQEISKSIKECTDLYVNTSRKNLDYLFFKDGLVGLKKYFNVETTIFNNLISIRDGFRLWDVDISKSIERSEEKLKFKYNPGQIKAIFNIVESSVSLVSGYAGTGKTSILDAIIDAYKFGGRKIVACALSAKAASRIGEATGQRAFTIHRLLEWNGKVFKYNEENTLPYDVIIVDEASMIGANIFMHLVLAVSKSSRIIIIGDDYQLPPIGYGNVFHDLLQINEFSINKLTEIMRQAAKSGISTDANMIRANKMPVSPTPMEWHGELQDMCYMFRDKIESLTNIAIKLYLRAVQQIGIDNVVIITPRKKDVINSSHNLNKLILDQLIPETEGEIFYNNITFRIGAKIIQRKNNYEKKVFNGDMGYIKSITYMPDDDNPKIIIPQILVEFNVMNEVFEVVYSKSELDELDLAYAMTCHLAQGSGYHTVIGICDSQHSFMLDSCMLYTILTRAKTRGVLLTQDKPFALGVRRNRSKTRKTWLSLL